MRLKGWRVNNKEIEELRNRGLFFVILGMWFFSVFIERRLFLNDSV